MAVFISVNLQTMQYFWDCYKLKTKNNLLTFFNSLYFVQLNFLDLNIHLQLQNMIETE